MCVKRGNMKVAYLLMDVTNVNFINDKSIGESVLKHVIQSRDIEMTNHILNFIKQNVPYLSNLNKVLFFFCYVCLAIKQMCTNHAHVFSCVF